jgi:methionyl-tRNA formyltransferase
MRIVIITQDEPFYLSENIDYLLKIMPTHSSIVGCVVASASPFGKKEAFYKKAKKTAEIFGMHFFVRYSLRFLWRKITGLGRVRWHLQGHGLKIIELENSINHPDSISKISDCKPDLLISILGNQIFKRDIIELAPKGCLNLHTALLPKYRGLMPTFWVLLNNERETGVSVFFVDEGIDSGPIVIQKRISINGMTQEQLIRKTKKIGMEAISEAVDLIEAGDVDLIRNDSSLMTYYSFPTKKDVDEFKAAGKKFF